MQNRLVQTIVLCSLLLFFTESFSQSKPQTLVEGGKTLVELIRVIKSPKKYVGTEGRNNNGQADGSSVDSCAIKKQSDLCYKNNSSKDIIITIYKRNGNGYEVNPFTMKVITRKQECWYELNAGIYRYRIETDDNGLKLLQAEGEFRLEPCDNMTREVNN